MTVLMLVTHPFLQGTPLLRSQSCCVPHNEPFPSPTSPGTDDPNKIGDLTKVCCHIFFCFSIPHLLFFFTITLQPYALPLVAGTVPDLKCISPETVSDIQ